MIEEEDPALEEDEDESALDLSNETEVKAEAENLRAILAQLRWLEKDLMDKLEQNKRLQEEAQRLRADNEQLRQQLTNTAAAMRRAKDPNPVQRPSAKRVMRLAADACMNLAKTAKGWELSFGSLKRSFRYLKQIWEIFTAEDWLLSDLFAPGPVETFKQPRLPFRHPILAGARP